MRAGAVGRLFPAARILCAVPARARPPPVEGRVIGPDASLRRGFLVNGKYPHGKDDPFHRSIHVRFCG